jgi:hypothetical protein
MPFMMALTWLRLQNLPTYLIWAGNGMSLERAKRIDASTAPPWQPNRVALPSKQRLSV